MAVGYRPSLEVPGALEFDTPRGPMLAQGRDAAELAFERDRSAGAPYEPEHYEAIALGKPPPMATSPGALALGPGAGQLGVEPEPPAGTIGSSGVNPNESSDRVMQAASAPPEPPAAPAPAAAPAGDVGAGGASGAAPPEPVASVAPPQVSVSEPNMSPAPAEYGGANKRRLASTPGGAGGLDADKLRQTAAQMAINQALSRPGGGNGAGAKLLEQTIEETAKAQDAVTQAQERVRQADQQRAAELARTQLEAERTFQAAREERQRAFDAREADFQARVDKAMKEREGMKIDPNHFWSTKTSGQKTMIAIGLALSGFGGGPNTVAQMVSQAVDHDIGAQKANIAAKDDQINTLRGLHRESLQVFGDKEQALAFTKAQAFQLMASEAATQALESGSPEAMAKAELITKAAEQQMVQFMANAAQQRQAMAARAAAGALTPEQRRKLLEHGADLLDKSGGSGRVPLGNGSIDISKLPEGQQADVRKLSASAQQVRGGLADLRSQFGQGKTRANSGVEATVGLLAFDVAMLAGQGQATKDNVDQLRKALIDVWEADGIDAVERYVDRRIDAGGSAYGGTNQGPKPTVQLPKAKAK